MIHEGLHQLNVHNRCNYPWHQDVITKPNICSHVCTILLLDEGFPLRPSKGRPLVNKLFKRVFVPTKHGCTLGADFVTSASGTRATSVTFFGLIVAIRKGSVQWWGIDIWTGYLLFFAMLLACSRPLLGHGEIARWDTRIRMGCHANKQGTCSVMVFCVAAFLGKASYALNHKQLLVATYNCTPAHKY